MGGTADPKVRLRVFNYLRTSGIQVNQANLVASRVVGAMAGTGKLPECVIAIAGAAITSNPTLDNMDETKSFALLEPKAEPYEAGDAKTPGLGSSALNPKASGKYSTGFGTAGPTVGGTSGKIGGPAATGFRGPIGMSKFDFAIIEPIMTRREVAARMGTKLSRTELQSHIGEIGRSFKG